MKNKRPVPPIAVGFLLGVGTALLLSGCTTTPPQTFDTWDEEWEPAPTPAPTPSPSPAPTGWQCGDRPCTDDEMQHLLDTLEKLEGQ